MAKSEDTKPVARARAPRKVFEPGAPHEHVFPCKGPGERPAKDAKCVHCALTFGDFDAARAGANKAAADRAGKARKHHEAAAKDARRELEHNVRAVRERLAARRAAAAPSALERELAEGVKAEAAELRRNAAAAVARDDARQRAELEHARERQAAEQRERQERAELERRAGRLEDALAIKCPVCGAAEGIACTRTAVPTVADLHPARLELAAPAVVA